MSITYEIRGDKTGGVQVFGCFTDDDIDPDTPAHELPGVILTAIGRTPDSLPAGEMLIWRGPATGVPYETAADITVPVGGRQ